MGTQYDWVQRETERLQKLEELRRSIDVVKTGNQPFAPYAIRGTLHAIRINHGEKAATETVDLLGLHEFMEAG